MMSLNQMSVKSGAEPGAAAFQSPDKFKLMHYPLLQRFPYWRTVWRYLSFAGFLETAPPRAQEMNSPEMAKTLEGLAAILNLAPQEEQQNGKQYGSPLGGNQNAPNNPSWQLGFAALGKLAFDQSK
jgi:hypothetical protein